MPKARTIAVALVVAVLAMGVLGCGDKNIEPSIPSDDAQTLLSQLEEIRANIDNGSCVVAGDRTAAFIDDVNALPSDVNGDVKQALESGAANLQNLLADPDQCSAQTDTTTTETQPTETTPSTTSTKSTPTQTQTQTQPTQTQPTQTQPTTPTNPGGGVGPGSPGGGGL